MSGEVVAPGKEVSGCRKEGREKEAGDPRSALQGPQPKKPRTSISQEENGQDELTSKDYYFDSYSHFGQSLSLSLSR